MHGNHPSAGSAAHRPLCAHLQHKLYRSARPRQEAGETRDGEKISHAVREAGETTCLARHKRFAFDSWFVSVSGRSIVSFWYNFLPVCALGRNGSGFTVLSHRSILPPAKVCMCYCPCLPTGCILQADSAASVLSRLFSPLWTIVVPYQKWVK